MALIEISTFIDARHLSSSQAIALAARATEGLGSSEFIEVVATDPSSVTDVDVWCRLTGHALVARSGNGATYSFVIGP